MITKARLVSCHGCTRHVRVGKPYCPFCGVKQPPGSAAPATRPAETQPRTTKPRKKTAFVPRGALRNAAAGVIPLCVVAGLSGMETQCGSSECGCVADTAFADVTSDATPEASDADATFGVADVGFADMQVDVEDAGSTDGEPMGDGGPDAMLDGAIGDALTDGGDGG
jgi:hypothetical protein